MTKFRISAACWGAGLTKYMTQLEIWAEDEKKAQDRALKEIKRDASFSEVSITNITKGASG